MTMLDPQLDESPRERRSSEALDSHAQLIEHNRALRDMAARLVQQSHALLARKDIKNDE